MRTNGIVSGLLLVPLDLHGQNNIQLTGREKLPTRVPQHLQKTGWQTTRLQKYECPCVRDTEPSIFEPTMTY
jgi:hypothetical protein